MLSRNYVSIPREARDELDELYSPDEVEAWWNAHHVLLDGEMPCECWTHAPDEVMRVIFQLKDGAYA